MGGGPRDIPSKLVKPVAGTRLTRFGMSNLFENLKTNILSTLSSRLDVLETKSKQEKHKALEKTMAVFCPKCRKKHALRECPTDSIEICQLCETEHSTDQCPSLPQLKEACMADQGDVNALYAMNPQRPWKPCPPGMSESNFQFPYAQNQTWNIPMPWQTWPPQRPPQQPWQGKFSYPVTHNFPNQNFYSQPTHQRVVKPQQPLQ